MKNHRVSDVHEPRSTFKVVTIAGALEEKVSRPDELFDCQMGSIVFNGMRIHDSRPNGLLTVSDVLAESSDVGSIKIGMRLGEDRVYKYIRAFGFAQQTGIELPGETRGLTKPVSRWSKVSIAAISMGQEIGITPLQLVGLISTMANDGIYVAPRIVAGTTQPQSAPQMIAFHSVNEHRVISSMTAAEMRQMMQAVVLHGTGTKARLIGYSSAGKTGTAQKADPALPSDRGRNVSTNMPDGRGARPSTNDGGVIPAAMREPARLESESRAAEPVAPAAHSAETQPTPNGTVVLEVEQGGITVPSFAGKSVRSAIELAESSGLDLDVIGSGRGQEQNPPAGAHVPSGARIIVKFGR